MSASTLCTPARNCAEIPASARESERADWRGPGSRYRFRLDIARPSGSRTIGAMSSVIGKLRSRTSARSSVACCKSFWPKTATSGCTRLNSLDTTVSTPAKCPGLIAPSQRSAIASGTTLTTRGPGYITVASGTNAIVAPCDSAPARSAASVRGYVARSSVGANCSGLTKMLSTTQSHRARARSISDKCPACSAPIVGTKPTRIPEARAAATATRNEVTSRTTCMLS